MGIIPIERPGKPQKIFLFPTRGNWYNNAGSHGTLPTRVLCGNHNSAIVTALRQPSQDKPRLSEKRNRRQTAGNQ